MSTTEAHRPVPSKAARLRAKINATEILALPGVFDGFSARLVQHMGFDAAFVTGAGISEARLGLPDVGIMGLEENVAACRALAAATDLVLLADGDTGYGNAVNVFHAVRMFESAGVAGLMLEDQLWPKRCGHMQGKQVIPMEEMVEKIRAAASARRDPDFVIKARTDSLATHGIDEVIKRLNAYAEAGADLLFDDAVLTREQIALVVRNVSKPVCVNMGFGIRARSTTPLLSAAQLQDLGVAVAIFPRMLTACALMGMRNGLELFRQSLASGEVVDRPDAAMSFEELNAIMGLAHFNALERQFVSKAGASRSPGNGAARDVTPEQVPAGAIDCHAHVMKMDIPLIAGRHSAPKREVSVDDYLGMLDHHGVAYGVLTAPSFYGSNNSLMIDALRAANGRLRGTGIVDPDISHEALAQMKAVGVDGIRLNLLARAALPDFSRPDYQRLFAWARDLDMHIEVFIEGELLDRVLPHIQKSGAKIVLDHFGCPDPVEGLRGDGFRRVLAVVEGGRTWVKLSAPYRLRGAPAQPYVDALLKAGGGDRLVWATDWPFVKFEDAITSREGVRGGRACARKPEVPRRSGRDPDDHEGCRTARPSAARVRSVRARDQGRRHGQEGLTRIHRSTAVGATVTADAAQARRFHMQLFNGTQTWVNSYLGVSLSEAQTRGLNPEVNDDADVTPVAYMVEQCAHSTIPGHYHRTDQFQIFVQGDGAFGTKPIEGHSLHYAAAYTPYAPISAGRISVQYFVFRLRYDPGAQWMPECKDRLIRAHRPRRAEFGPIDVKSAQEVAALQGVQVVDVLVQDESGLGSWLYRIGPNRSARGPSPAGGRGQFWLVLDGTCELDGATAAARSLCFIARNDAPVLLRAGAAGVQVVGVQFARAELRYAQA